MSTTELDKVLNKQDRIQRVHELWKSIPGASDEQAIAASATLAERFEWTGSVLNLDGKPATVDAVRQHFGTSYAFLLPAENATNKDAPQVDPAALALARTGNKTAYQKVYLTLGRDKAATDALIAGKAADDTQRRDDKTGRFVADDKDNSNPWRSPNFRTDKAAQAAAAGIIRRMGTKAAASLAKAAGKTIDGKEAA